MRNVKIAVFALLLLSFVISASAVQPGQAKFDNPKRVTTEGIKDGPGPGPDGPHGPNGPPTYSVAEPAAIALLGSGLIALGIYAKKKRSKKQ